MLPMQSAVERVVREGILEREPHAAILYDMHAVRERVDALRRSFPPETVHAIAIKACPIAELLRRTTSMGCGAETASSAELQHALALEIPPSRIVFDSPAKTWRELEYAFRHRVHVNADSLQELDRIAKLVEHMKDPLISVGVRVNPGVRGGRIRATSTAVPGSKFGVSLADEEDELLSRFRSYPWLRGLHVHVGSQGCDIGLLTEAVSRVLDLALRIERLFGSDRLDAFDLGGGLPVAYRPRDRAPGFGEYATALQDRVPEVFSRPWRVITEFGRSIWANTAAALSRVEYTKTSHGQRIAVIHLGADMFLRTAYAPGEWHHEVSVYDSAGRPKDGARIGQDIAGPLCFSGDLIARRRKLPPIEVGDHILVHDVGAYTLSMWSRYNSRLSPPVYGFAQDADDFVLLRRGETVNDVLRFWQ